MIRFGVVTISLLLQGPAPRGRAPATPDCGAETPGTLRASQSLLRARDAVWHAWFAGDVVALDSLLTGDLIAIDDGAAGWQDKQAAMRSSRTFAASGGRLAALTFPQSLTQLHGNVAVLVSRFDMRVATTRGGYTELGRSTEVFVCQRGRWVNSSWHLSREPERAR